MIERVLYMYCTQNKEKKKKRQYVHNTYNEHRHNELMGPCCQIGLFNVFNRQVNWTVVCKKSLDAHFLGLREHHPASADHIFQHIERKELGIG